MRGEPPQHGTAFDEPQGTGINIDPGLPPLGSVRGVFLQNKKWQPGIDRVSVEDARGGLRDDASGPRPLEAQRGVLSRAAAPELAPLITMSRGLIVESGPVLRGVPPAPIVRDILRAGGLMPYVAAKTKMAT